MDGRWSRRRRGRRGRRRSDCRGRLGDSWRRSSSGCHIGLIDLGILQKEEVLGVDHLGQRPHLGNELRGRLRLLGFVEDRLRMLLLLHDGRNGSRLADGSFGQRWLGRGIHLLMMLLLLQKQMLLQLLLLQLLLSWLNVLLRLLLLVMVVDDGNRRLLLLLLHGNRLGRRAHHLHRNWRLVNGYCTKVNGKPN